MPVQLVCRARDDSFHQGLTLAASAAWKEHRTSRQLYKKLHHLDVKYNVMRHLTKPSVEELISEIRSAPILEEYVLELMSTSRAPWLRSATWMLRSTA